MVYNECMKYNFRNLNACYWAPIFIDKTNVNCEYFKNFMHILYSNFVFINLFCLLKISTCKSNSF